MRPNDIDINVFCILGKVKCLERALLEVKPISRTENFISDILAIFSWGHDFKFEQWRKSLALSFGVRSFPGEVGEAFVLLLHLLVQHLVLSPHLLLPPPPLPPLALPPLLLVPTLLTHRQFHHLVVKMLNSMMRKYKLKLVCTFAVSTLWYICFIRQWEASGSVKLTNAS